MATDCSGPAAAPASDPTFTAYADAWWHLFAEATIAKEWLDRPAEEHTLENWESLIKDVSEAVSEAQATRRAPPVGSPEELKELCEWVRDKLDIIDDWEDFLAALAPEELEKFGYQTCTLSRSCARFGV